MTVKNVDTCRRYTHHTYQGDPLRRSRAAVSSPCSDDIMGMSDSQERLTHAKDTHITLTKDSRHWEERIISLTLELTRSTQKAHLTTMTVVVRLEDSIACLKVRVCEGSEGIRRRNERRERREDHLTYTIAHSTYIEGSPHYNDCHCKAGGFHCMPEGTCV